jgi:Dihaem cytochrome c
MKHFIANMLALAAFTGAALAEGSAIQPITDPVVAKECSACHMAFQPQMLSARSWEALMGDLANHFGENASLDQATADTIKAYLVANAADANGAKSRWTKGVDASQTPLRITETPFWIGRHQGEVSPKSFQRADVGSKANCKACHSGADKGFFGDD